MNLKNMEFYNNKINDSLKFKINSEGINTNNMETRLILKSNENKNYLFFGEINKDICEFDIPKLETYEKGDKGKIKFEIISEDLYFPVWEDAFDINTKASIKLEGLITEQQHKEEKPKISVSTINVQPIIEKKKDIELKTGDGKTTINREKTKKPIKKVINKDINEEKIPIKNFNSFFK